MKIRNGFVSNSSSASFIIKWKPKYEEERTITQHLMRLFDIYNHDMYDEKTDSIKNVPNYYQENVDIINEIVKNTTIEKNNVFVSDFYTSMMNSYLDFGSSSAFLLMTLYNEKESYKIVKTELIRD